MTAERIGSTDYSLCSLQFINGINCMANNEVFMASYCFELAYKNTSKKDKFYNKYVSFYGYSRILMGDRNGLFLCRKAAQEEFYDGDVFHNLAKAEWRYDNRKRTVDALFEGLKVDRGHVGMRNFKKLIGFREKRMIWFLPRSNPINNYFGKLLRK